MRPIILICIIILSYNSIRAQTKEISETYELNIKDQKILDALSICFSDFDHYVKNYKHYVYKVFLTYHSQDDLEMTIDYFTTKDTIQFTQPDHYFKYEDRVAFVYNGENLLTKKDDPDFYQYILAVCREKMELSNSNRQKNSKPIEANHIKNTFLPNQPLPENASKVLPSDTKGLVLKTHVVVNPLLKYHIRKRNDKVEITGLSISTI